MTFNDIYKKTLTGVLYSSGFALTLVGLSLVTTLVIMAVTSNVVLSLGMVGTLSIVRFRTAIKEPVEIVFLFWSLAVGIVIGAGMIPLAVIGGLEIYLFGAIAAQGMAIMIDKKVDMFSSKNIAVIASIMVIGIGGNYAFGGNIPFFGLNVPCIAGAAIFGIILNALLSIGEKKKENP